MASELKLCPFCGAEPDRVGHAGGIEFFCSNHNCGVQPCTAPTNEHDAVQRWNTRPATAATDTGLVKTPRDTACTIVDAIHRYTWEFSPNPTAHKEQYDLVEKLINDLLAGTRSQAEELLAAKDAAYERLEHQALKDRKLRSEAQSDADLWRFSVDMGDHPSLLVKLWRQRKALEAKLTAAEKALEPFSDHANDQAVDDTGWRDKETVKIVVSIGDLRKARAVLGGKPS